MAAIYPHAWTSALGDDPSGVAADTWASALSGLTPAQLAEGLRACVAEGREWPPSAGRFRAMCLGIPTLAAVRLQRQGKLPITAFARMVSQHVDEYAVQRAPSAVADRMLAEAYDVARELVMRGHPLPDEPVGAIAAEAPAPSKPADPAHVSRVLGEIDQLLPKPPAPVDLGPEEVERQSRSAKERGLPPDRKTLAAGGES